MNDHIPDVTKMISDTPRTDAVYFKQGATMYDLANEMKLVERELNAANEMFKKLNIHALNLTDRIKRLEEALTEIELAMKQPASNHRLMQISGPARQVINIIKKAKEAKP